MMAAAMPTALRSRRDLASPASVSGSPRPADRCRSYQPQAASASPRPSRLPPEADSMTTQPAGQIAILLVDDHPVVRQGYRRVLQNQSDFEVVAEADSAASAYAAFKAHAPDVVVMDISMKGASG